MYFAVGQQLPYTVSRWQTDQANSTFWLIILHRSAQVRFESLAAHVAQLSSNGNFLLAGDFEARDGVAAQPWVTDLSGDASAQLQNSDSTVHTHGRKLLHLSEETAMVLYTGRIPGDTAAQSSFKACSNTAPSRLDHALVDCGLFAAIQACCIGSHWQESGHFSLELHLLLTALLSSLPQAQASFCN